MFLRRLFSVSGLSWLDWVKLAMPALLLLGGVVALLWRFVEPAPPGRVVIAAGEPEGTYSAVARRYADFFRTRGIELEVRHTAGAVENFRLLLDPASGVDCAIVQGGTAPPTEQTESLEGVCSIYFEPLWVFYRGQPITRLAQLQGKRLAIGGEGSGTRALARSLLALNGVKDDDPNFQTIDLGGQAAADALKNGEIDLMCLVTAPSNPMVKDLAATQGVRLLSFEQANAYGRILPYLKPVTLYRGSLDLQRNIPDDDVTLVAPTAYIVARDSTHKAVIQLLVEAAKATHAHATLLNDAGAFPNAAAMEIEPSDEARYFLTQRPGLLQRKLPFWAASLVDRMLILVIPLLAIMIPLIRIAPPVYRWRVRSKIYRWYRRLQAVEGRLRSNPDPAELAKGTDDLANVEKELAATNLPLGYMEEAYNLRLHIAYLRGRLGDYLKQGGTPS